MRPTALPGLAGSQDGVAGFGTSTLLLASRDTPASTDRVTGARTGSAVPNTG